MRRRRRSTKEYKGRTDSNSPTGSSFHSSRRKKKMTENAKTNWTMIRKIQKIESNDDEN